MATDSDPERALIHAARMLVVRGSTDIEEASTLLGQGEQVIALFPSNLERGQRDSLTFQTIESARAIGATVSAVQVAAVGDGPRRWRRWMQKLKWSRTLILSPTSLADPSVTVAWLPEAETGIERLMVGEMTSFNLGFTEMSAAEFDEIRRRSRGSKGQH